MNRQLTRRLSTIVEKLGRTSDDQSSAIRTQLLGQLSDADLKLLEQALTLVDSGQETALSGEQRGTLYRWDQIYSEALAPSKEKKPQGQRTIRSSQGVR